MAGRIQLATTGPQDQFFTLDPEYTLFKENFRKHSNYSVEFVNIEPDQQIVDYFGKTVRYRIPSNAGDLLKTCSLAFTLPGINQLASNVGYIDSVGHALIEYADILIDDQIVHRVTSDWFQIYSEHYFTQTKQNALYQLVGKYPYRTAGTRSNDKTILGHLGTSTADVDFYVDIPFYNYREPELALPLCAICTSEVEIEIKFRKYEDLIVDTYDGSLPVLAQPITFKNVNLQCEMVFLDDVEKIKFKKTPVDYLIVQNQQQNFVVPKNQNTAKFKLRFVNPVKELYFVIQSKGARVFDYDNYRETSDVDNKLILFEHLNYLKLTLDGEEVLTEKTGKSIFLKAVQAGIHHSKTQLIRRFYSYSFALEPEKHYPSGHINFTVIKDQVLELNLHSNVIQDREVRVYARAYNVLRVAGGKAKLIFGNQ